MPIWYVQDEVGSAISHSDKPNMRSVPFMYSPKNSPTDEDTLPYNIMWPVSDIKCNDGIYRDYLYGNNEQDMFRSARLHTWFNVPEDYFKKTLIALRQKEANVDVEAEHTRIQ